MAAVDISPALLAKIKADFMRILGDAAVTAQTYIGAAEYAELVGEALARAFQLNVSSAVLPNGKLYQNIAESIVRPMMQGNYNLVSAATVEVQQALNSAANLSIKAQIAQVDNEKITGIINKASSATRFDDVAWVLGEPVKTFTRSVVDDTLKKNVTFQGRLGLTPKIIRIAEPKCCEWCSNLDGVYRYPDVPDGVYQRHERCRCRTDYDPGSGKRQNVWSKQAENGQVYKKGQAAQENRVKELETRKAFAQDVVDHPGRILSADPATLRAKFRDQKIRTFDLKNGGYAVDLGNNNRLKYDGAGNYSLLSGGKETWKGSKIKST